MAHRLLNQSAHRGSPLALVPLLGLAGCLYTDPINMPPMVKIIPPDPLERGREAVFSATPEDPDRDALTLRWTHAAGDCPGSHERSVWPAQPWSDNQSYRVAASDTLSRFCVWAFVTDALGATGVATYQADPPNRPPTLTLRLAQPTAAAEYPLYTTFALEAVANDPDGDALQMQWALDAPVGSSVTAADCGDPSRVTCQFTPDVPGTYHVTVGAGDGSTAPASAQLSLVVRADAPPCIDVDSLTPAVTPPPARIARDPDADVTFSVLKVADDGDPFPGAPSGVTQFSWFVGRGGDPLVYVGHDFNEYTIPARTFRLGDEVRVRVEVRDRDGARIDTLLLSCSDEAPACGSVAGCYQRVTWRVAF